MLTFTVIRESETANSEVQSTRSPKDKEQTSQEVPRIATVLTTGLLEVISQSISALFRLSNIARNSSGTQNVELEDQPMQALIFKRRIGMARAYLSPDLPKPPKYSLDAAVDEALAEINHKVERLGTRQLPFEDRSSTRRYEQIKDTRSLHGSQAVRVLL